MSEWIKTDKFKPEKSCNVYVHANDIVSSWVEIAHAYVCPECKNVIFKQLNGEDYKPIIIEVMLIDLPEPPK